MIVLSCKDICKSYGIRDILKNITFSINEGDKVGVIGPNGEGKSTLFKIITKELSQDSGEVFIDKTSNLGYLSQNLSLDSSKTIYEETLSVFEELLNIENRLATLEVKMNEPYDASNAAYHDKLIKDYTTLQDIYSHKGGYIYKGEISRVLNGLGFVEELFDKEISTFLRFMNLSPNSPLLSLSLPNNTELFNSVEYLETTGYYMISSGIYNLQVTIASDESVKKYINNISFDNGNFYTIYIIGLFNDTPKLGYLLTVDYQ